MNELEEVSRDVRGWIYRLVRPGGHEVIFIFTKRGFWRGGEYHKSAQNDFLIFGKLHWLLVMPMSGTWLEVARGVQPKYAPEAFWTKHDQTRGRFNIEPYEAHVVRAEEDTLYVEWLDGPFEKTYIPEMRVLVDRALKG